MKKIISILVCSFLFCFSVSAMQSLSGEKKSSSKETLQKKVKELEDYLQIRKQYYNYLPTYLANCYLTTDLLVWTANNHGWPFYLQLGGSSAVPVFKTVYKDFDFDVGVRVGFGYKTPYDWELLLLWTGFWHDITQSKRDDYGLMAAFVPVSFYKAKSKWNLTYHMADLESARVFNSGKYFAMRPHFGLRGGWFDQKGDNNYEDPIAPPLPGEATVPARTYYREKMWVLGPRVGFDGDLFFGKTGLSLYGNLAAALLYANVKSELTIWDTEDGNLSERGTTLSDIDDLKATLQLAFGLSWGDFISSDKDRALRFRIGWEANYWWNQFQEYIVWRNTDDTYNYNINQPVILQGVTINARFDF